MAPADVHSRRLAQTFTERLPYAFANFSAGPSGLFIVFANAHFIVNSRWTSVPIVIGISIVEIVFSPAPSPNPSAAIGWTNIRKTKNISVDIMQRTSVTYLKGQIQKAVSTLFDPEKNVNWADTGFQIDFDQNEKQGPKTNLDEIMFHRVLPNKIGQTLTVDQVADLLTTATNEIPLFIRIKSLQPLKLYGLSISKRFRKLADIERHHKDNPLTPLLPDMAKDDEIICSSSYITVYADRLIIQSRKIVLFNNIVCIKAIPCYFRSSPYSGENDVDFFIEITLQTNKKIILSECEGHVIEAFKKYKNVTFNSLLTLDDVLPKFGQTKYFFASLLFELSPLRVTLWIR